MPLPPLVLASTSPWRKDLLARLGLPFTTIDPQLDEAPWHARGMDPEGLVLDLAGAKARAAVARGLPQNAIVLAADQVGCIEGEILLKPETRARAIEQLGLLSGRTHRLLTGLVLLDTRDGTEHSLLDIEHLKMRDLTLSERSNYVDREDVLGCAGSYRIEGLGISLFESISGPDWTGVVGLPLISVTELLQRVGISPLS